MNLRVLRWLIADTFRQSIWSGAFWLLLAASGACMIFCLTVRPEQAHQTAASLGIGANVAGLLLALTVTAGFIPAFVDPNSALILLAKPVRRWQMLAGKFVGVLAFFALQAFLFVAGTWLALGLATGVWPAGYLWTWPLLLLNFAAFYSFSVMLAVTTRNTVACVFGTLLFWLLCWFMNVGRHALAAYDVQQFSTASRWLAEGGYWLLPKPADLSIVLYNSLHPEPVRALIPEFAGVEDRGAFRPVLALAASLVFPLVALAIAGYELETADY